MVTKTELSTPRLTGSELSASVTERIKELAEATDTARRNELMIRYLETTARFHQYSVFNIWCILMACPHATRVAGYQKWKEFNRYVRKGEKGIPILAPILVLEDSDDPSSKQILRGFKVVYVFDISQTEGDPLPEQPCWKSTEKNAHLYARLVEFARSKGIQVEVKPLKGDIQGISKGGLIEIAPTAGTKTLIHELAHELMHHSQIGSLDPAIRELEAESVAYVVARHFGLEGLNCPNYIVLLGLEFSDLMGYMDRIRLTAIQIIQGLEISPLDKKDISAI